MDRAAGACFTSVHTRYARTKPIRHRTTDVDTHTHLHLKSLDRGPPVSGAEDSRVRVVIVMGVLILAGLPAIVIVHKFVPFPILLPLVSMYSFSTLLWSRSSDIR